MKFWDEKSSNIYALCDIIGRSGGFRPILQKFNSCLPDLVLVSTVQPQNRQSIEAALSGSMSKLMFSAAESPIKHDGILVTTWAN